VSAVVCTGVDASSVAVRLKYAGVPEAKITVIEAMDRRVEAAMRRCDGTIVAILNFDVVQPFVRLLHEADDSRG